MSRATFGSLPWRSSSQHDLSAQSFPAHNFVFWSQILQLLLQTTSLCPIPIRGALPGSDRFLLSLFFSTVYFYPLRYWRKTITFVFECIHYSIYFCHFRWVDSEMVSHSKDPIVRVSPSDILKRGQVMVYLVGMRKILSLPMRPARTTVTAIVLSAKTFGVMKSNNRRQQKDIPANARI